MTLTTAAPQPTSTELHPRSHIAALDGLRGLAVIAVLFFHAGKLQGGFLGVDLFFVLSGFLITSLLLAEASKTEAVGLKAFWARRARRLAGDEAGQGGDRSERIGSRHVALRANLRLALSV